MKNIVSLLAICLALGCTDNGKTNPVDASVSDVGTDSGSIGAAPCIDFSTGFAGDSQCLAAPPEDKGFQLHYGPSNYDDPEEVNKYIIQPSEELVDCIFTKTPNKADIYVNEYHARLRPGTHHMITYIEPGDRADSTAPEECRQGAEFTFLVGATTLTTDITAGGPDSAPEYKGSALKIPATSQAAIQLHYLNTTSEPILKEGWINVLYADTVTLEVNPITWLGGIGMAVPPRSKQTIIAGGGTCTVSQDLNIITLVGHAHAHTTQISTYIQRAGSSDKQLIYRTYDWHEPGFINYNSVTINDAPDPVAKTMGGISGILVAKPGDQLWWECEVNNTTDIVLQFSDKALTGEMCNIFGVYAPSTGSPWSCISL
jgi:hypothetical protein